MASNNNGFMSKLSGLVSRHPYIAVAAVGCAAATTWLAYEAMKPQPLYRKDDDDDEPDGPSEFDSEIAAAVEQAHVNSQFSHSELVEMYTKWFRQFGGELNFQQFGQVFREFGVTDTDVLKRTFAMFDADNSGTIDFSELLTILSIHSSGSSTSTSKLQLMFASMDLNNDGVVEADEMARFFRSTFKCIGVRKSEAEIQSIVARIFSAVVGSERGLDFPTFCKTLKEHHFFLPNETFDAFTKYLTRGMVEILGDAAADESDSEDEEDAE